MIAQGAEGMSSLAGSVPAAVAVIIVVGYFLRHLQGRDKAMQEMIEAERASRDAAQKEFLATMRELGRPIDDMSKEVALLRQQLQEIPPGG